MASTPLSAQEIARQIGATDPSVLVTRHFGGQFLSQLKAILARADRNDVVRLSFAGVNVMDPSFADEVLGTLGSERASRKFSGACLVLEDVGPNLHDDIATLLDGRPRRTRIGNCVFPLQNAAGEIELIGPHEKHVEESFRFIQRKGSITARDLQTHLNATIGAASTRLKILHDLGLIVRSADRSAPGGQFLYSIPR